MVHMKIVSSPLVAKVSGDPMHLVLPHLYAAVPHYLEQYSKLSLQGAFIMQDNSIFELKESVTNESILESGKKIHATELVVPEVLRDSEKSKEKVQRFLDYLSYDDLGRFQFAAVIQGKNYSELIEYYEWLCQFEEISTICIPFNFEFDAFGNQNETFKQKGWNRFSIIYKMVLDGVWNTQKDHHLLGLYNPAELAQYNRFVITSSIWDSIRSNDSSSVFWHSLYGLHYDLGIGLPYKKIETHVDFNQSFEHTSQFDNFDFNSEIIEAYSKGHEGYALGAYYLRVFAEHTNCQAPQLVETFKNYLGIIT